MWSVCTLCGCVVADDHLHTTWHAAIEPVQDDPDPAEEA